jgi:8-oxo-dGTP pyrophosphatase MutT (NUDIX family)
MSAKTSVFDALDRDPPPRLGEGVAPRPRDAATLILVQRKGPVPRVLMGRRSGGHSFMPDKYVFPGGRVDPQDARMPSCSEPRADHLSPLAHQTRRSLRAFPLTAIRETFEETGLIVGRPAPVLSRVPQGWRDYAAQGALPCLESLVFIGRAITPPYRHKRFDARFFMADADTALIDDRPPADTRELQDLAWVTLEEAASLDLPAITQFMLAELAEHLDPDRPNPRPPLLKWAKGRHALVRL